MWIRKIVNSFLFNNNSSHECTAYSYFIVDMLIYTYVVIILSNIGLILKLQRGRSPNQKHRIWLALLGLEPRKSFSILRVLIPVLISPFANVQKDTVGIYARNRAEWLITAMASSSQSLVIVPLYDTLGTLLIIFVKLIKISLSYVRTTSYFWMIVSEAESRSGTNIMENQVLTQLNLSLITPN